MTDTIKTKRRRLSREILGLIALSALLSVIMFCFLSGTAGAIAEVYCFDHDVPMTEFDWLELEHWIFSVSAIVSVVFFTVLFLSLLADRMHYIQKITDGIHALRTGQQEHVIPLEGNNELTELADSINYLSTTQRQIREKELVLSREKEQLIRTLSHDIRTPLTSILAYSEYLAEEGNGSSEERKAYLQTIRRKAEQIRDLTDILLDGGKRNPEHFENARTLIEQLAAEFEETLEDRFDVRTDLSGCPFFAASLDVQEMRRIFDNLCSNICKYADPDQPVFLSVWLENHNLLIRQSNLICSNNTPEDSYGLGINSIRRIAQYYGGRVITETDENKFEITIIISEI